jgi:hypothetical protein
VLKIRAQLSSPNTLKDLSDVLAPVCSPDKTPGKAEARRDASGCAGPHQIDASTDQPSRRHHCEVSSLVLLSNVRSTR